MAGYRMMMRTGLLALAAFACVHAAQAEPALPQGLDLSTIRAIPVQHDGRWPAFDTLARDVVETVTGTQQFRGHDPVLLLLAWTFDAEAWQAEPLIHIGSAELRGELKLPASQTDFSFNQLTGHTPLLDQFDALRKRQGGKMNPLESKVSAIQEMLMTLVAVFRNQTISVVPDPTEFSGAWQALPLSAGPSPAGAGAALRAWAATRDAFLKSDAAAFATATQEFSSALAALPAAHRPTPRKIAVELHSNSLRPFHWAWVIMAIGVLLSVISLPIRLMGFELPSALRSIAMVFSVLALIAGFAMLTYGLSLRWQIAGRIPAANMYESLLFLSWGAGLFGILSLFVFRDRFVPLTASAMGALALFLSDVLPLDSFVRPIAPVLLDTVWMSIHVPIIMVSYAVLAIAVLIAHIQLVLMAFAPRNAALWGKMDRMHYWYVFAGTLLLLAGIITGSMWAASSWGRYWGWDPKEVWSLIAFCAYMASLHVRIDKERVPRWMYFLGGLMIAAVISIASGLLGPMTPMKFAAFAATILTMVFFVAARGPFAMACKSILAFWMIIMTYVGVNFVLGTGLHSYGFGTGAVVKYMTWLGITDIGFMIVFGLIYAAHIMLTSGGRPTPARA